MIAMYWFCNIQQNRFIPLLLVLAHTNSFQYGVVTPQDPFLFEGEPLHLYCNITNPTVRENSSSLFFETSHERRPSQILNTRAIRLMMPQVTLDDQGTYMCLVRTIESKVKVIGSQHVNIDVKPTKVKNVSCRVYNWEEMTCTWDLGTLYRHPQNVNLSVFWVTTIGQEVLSQDVQQDCPWLSKTSCHWDREHYRHGLHYSIRIVVTYSVKGQVKEEASKMESVNTIERVEPAPVHELRAYATNSTCIMLTWDLLRVMYRKKSFIQQIKRHGSTHWEDVISAPSVQIKEDRSAHNSLVCDLDRNSQYDFRVAVIPLYDGRQTGSMSEWKTATAYTDEDVPSAAPIIFSGCFFDIPVAGHDLTGTRRVRIMWKAIPETSLHGTLTHYKISYWSLTSPYSNIVFSYVIDKTKPVTSIDLTLPYVQEDYRVSIVGATRKGESLNASFILIPALKDKPASPQRFLVKRNREEHESRRFFLSWAALNTGHVSKRSSIPLAQRHASYRHAVSGLHIVWCAGSRISWQCQGEPGWVRLPPTHVTYELNTNITQTDHYDLLIGIAVEVKVGQKMISSGIHWSTCLYTRNQKPKMAPQDVRFSPTSTADSLVVTWRKPGCREETAYITEYLVRYCPCSTDNQCVGDRITLNVSGEATGLTIPHLARNTKYLVYVEAVSSAGLGPPSDDIWHMVEPIPPEENLSSLILIVVAIMCVSIVAIACICFIRCCYRKNQKLPAVEDLLEIQPTQKYLPALHHHRDRPLPEPPSEAPVDHHKYGTRQCSTHACTRNHGYEEFQVLIPSENLLEDGVPGNRLYFSQNQKGLDSEFRQRQIHSCKNPFQFTGNERNASERIALLNEHKEAITQQKDCIFPNPDKIGDGSADTVIGSAQSYQRISIADTCIVPGRRKDSSAGSHTFEIPSCFDTLCNKHVNINKKDKVPLNNQILKDPIVKPVVCDGNTDIHVKHFYSTSPPSRAAKCDDYLSYSQIAHLNSNQRSEVLSHNVFILPKADQDFCTCDDCSDDSLNVDLNANSSAPYKLHSPPKSEKHCDFSTNLDIHLDLLFPRPISTSPSPPPQPAPPVPIEESRDRCSHDIQQRHSLSLNSSDYLEPQLISSGYCTMPLS